jgi:hypothetical protein
MAKMLNFVLEVRKGIAVQSQQRFSQITGYRNQAAALVAQFGA